MNKTLIAILLLAAVAVQAKYIPEVQDAIVRYPELIKRMKANIDATSRDALPDTKIVGGTTAKEGQFPYQCHLSLTVNGRSYFCGCSILSDTWILTAAHCPDGASKVAVTLGDTDRTVPEANEIQIDAASWTLHENWNTNFITNDIAVIKLSTPAVLGTAIQRICLADTSEPEDKHAGQDATVSGWGKTADIGGVSTDLNYAVVKVENYTTCNRQFLAAFSHSNICTSTATGQSTCNGDSGGPLVIYDADRKDTIQIGIVSFGASSSCTDRVSVFTRVASFREWVGNHTESAILC